MQGTRESKENQKEDEETGNEQQDDTKAGAVHNENTKSGVNLGVNFSISTGFGCLSFVNAASRGAQPGKYVPAQILQIHKEVPGQ